MTAPLRILILSDGKPGHAAGSVGVAKSIERLRPAETTTLTVKLRAKFTRPLLKRALNHGWFKRMSSTAQDRLARLFYSMNPPADRLNSAAFDWVISSGGDTSFLNAWFHQARGTRNIYCSALRGLRPSLFTLLVSSRPRPTLDNQIELTMAPVPIDREAIAKSGREFRAEKQLGDDLTWALLIGGNGAGYAYDADTFERLIDLFLVAAEKHDAKLLVTTSRRTGLKLEKRLERGLAGQSRVAHVTYFNQNPEKVVARFLGAADAVFCTAESGAMIREAMAAGKPTYAIRPAPAKPEAYYERFLERHAEARRLEIVALEALADIVVPNDPASAFETLKSSPVEELAERLKPWIDADA